ncbi:MAG: MarC family protein [Rhodospirillales bacterium]|nr:MarC family protein [Rhodospirillales bacterium]
MDIFLPALVTIFVVVDPLGTAAVFSALLSGQDVSTARKTAFRASITAAGLLVAFGLMGDALLHHLGISIGAFRIAGGLLLFVTAFRMLMGFHDPDQLESEETAYSDRTDVAIFPLSIPLLAGPGAMTASILHMTAVHTIEGKVLVIIAIVAVQLIALFSMLGADRLVRLFGPSGSSLLARIMGVLMAAMAVQFMIDGAAQTFNF